MGKPSEHGTRDRKATGTLSFKSYDVNKHRNQNSVVVFFLAADSAVAVDAAVAVAVAVDCVVFFLSIAF